MIEMENKTPLISVLMPAYNAEKYIGIAIESILSQAFKDFELIIIDDCSKDSSYLIAEKYFKEDDRIVLLKNCENLKLSLTLNRGIKIARGKYIARMDADDFSYSDRLEKQYNFLEMNPGVGIVGGTMEVCDSKLNFKAYRRYNLDDENIRKNIFKYSPFSHPLVMIRKEIFDEIGLYDTATNPAEDYDLWLRIGKCCKFANLEDVLLKYRIVEKSMTTGSTKKMELATIKLRNKYAKDYNMSRFDRVYNFLQLLSVYILPDKINAKLKIWLFNLTRDKK